MSAEPINLVLGTARLKREWEGLSPKLQEIALYIALRRKQEMKVDSRVSCIYRSPKENEAVGAKSQTHVEWRAIDITIRNSKSLGAEEKIREEVNTRWPTGIPDMPRVPPLFHGTGPHFHIQATREEKTKEHQDEIE